MQSKMRVLVGSTATCALLIAQGTSASAQEGPSVGRLSAGTEISAQGGPTVRELLEKCNHGTDYCGFHPRGDLNVYRGEYRLAGGATNCTPDRVSRWIDWSSSEYTMNNVGIEMSAEGGFGAAFKVGFRVSYNREWGWSTTKADRVIAEISPYRAVNVQTAPMKQTVSGDYELHFGYKYYGHYYWYVYNVQVTGPANDSWDIRVDPADANC